MAGDVIGGQKNRPLQIKRVRSGDWTKSDRKRFLDVLASTCNVRAAAEAVGRSRTSPYKLRAADQAFAALWSDALAIGYERLEMAVLRRALFGVNALEIEGDEPELSRAEQARPDELAAPDGGTPSRSGGLPSRLAPVPELSAALAVLDRHRATVEGRRLPHANRRRATDEETDAALKKALDGLAKRLRKAAE